MERFIRRVTTIVCLVLATAAPSSAGQLTSFTSENYQVHTDLPRQRVAEMVSHMDLVYAEYRKRFKSFKPKDRSRPALYLFDQQGSYVGFLAEHDIDGRNSGGMFAYDSRTRFHGLLTYTAGRPADETLAVLQHEGFHQFAHTYLGYELPPWANEGLAQYFEDGILVAGKMHLGSVNPPRLARVKAALAGNGPSVSFKELIEMGSNTWHQTLTDDPDKSAVLYAYAWSVAHFLIHADHGRYARAFGGYLELLAAGKASGEAFGSAFGAKDLEPMRRKWAAYVKELEPDALAEAALRMRMIAAGMLWLDRHGMDVPADLGVIEHALARSEYRWGYTIEGQSLQVSATEPDSFAYTDARGQPNRFTLEAPKAGESGDEGEQPINLPLLSAPGLRPTPAIRWEREEDGTLTFRLVYR